MMAMLLMFMTCVFPKIRVLQKRRDLKGRTEISREMIFLHEMVLDLETHRTLAQNIGYFLSSDVLQLSRSTQF